ncbi:MAG TPA: HAD-IA family hydrolase [Mycobacteriales bacterium]|nr:HAD-IA family hydrolase [Mycobacteriales bacterium]
MTTIPCTALLFDMDGTLVDSSGPIRRAWTRFIQRWNVDAAELASRAHGRRDTDIVALFLPPEHRAEGVALVRNHELTDTDGIVPVAGAAQLLDSLAGRPWAVVTSATRDLATVRLRAAGLPTPDVLVTADDVASGKPDPQGYLTAAQRLAVPPPECLVVEDAPAGIAAGRAAGARTLAVETTHRAAALPDADWVVPDLRSVRVRPDGLELQLEESADAR